MKKTSRILTIIGLIMNSVMVATRVVQLLMYQRLAYITYSNMENVYPKFFPFEIFKIFYLVAMIILVASLVGALILASISFALINKGKTNKAPHILIIVSGVLTDIPFYIIGGILGLIASIRENRQKQIQIEKPEEIVVEVDNG